MFIRYKATGQRTKSWHKKRVEFRNYLVCLHFPSWSFKTLCGFARLPGVWYQPFIFFKSQIWHSAAFFQLSTFGGESYGISVHTRTSKPLIVKATLNNNPKAWQDYRKLAGSPKMWQEIKRLVLSKYKHFTCNISQSVFNHQSAHIGNKMNKFQNLVNGFLANQRVFILFFSRRCLKYWNLSLASQTMIHWVRASFCLKNQPNVFLYHT